MEVNKILGSEKPADVLTTFVDGKTTNAAVETLHMKFYSRRIVSAPAAMGSGNTQEPSTQ